MFPYLCHLVSMCYQVYYEPMLKLDIMTESELGQIFGTLDSLIPLHQGKASLCIAHTPIISISTLVSTQPPHYLIFYGARRA